MVRGQMRVVREKTRTEKNKPAAVRSTMQGTPNSNDSDGVVTTMAKSAVSKK